VLKFWTYITVFGLLVLTAVPALSNVGITVNWGAFTHPILDDNGEKLKDLCLVQLIWDADHDGVDEPGEDGLPSGGDELLDISFIGSGSFFAGKFSRNTDFRNVGTDERIYVRAWNAEKIAEATRYGDTRVLRDGFWTIDNRVGLTVDATEEKAWRTTMPWVPTGIALGRLARRYRAELLQNHPNPFYKSTTIGYCVPGVRTWELMKGGDRNVVYDETDLNSVNIRIYDVSGRMVRKVVGAHRLAGYHQIIWDTKDDRGRKVPSGSYFCRLSIKGSDGSARTITKKMVLLK